MVIFLVSLYFDGQITISQCIKTTLDIVIINVLV